MKNTVIFIIHLCAIITQMFITNNPSTCINDIDNKNIEDDLPKEDYSVNFKTS